MKILTLVNGTKVLTDEGIGHIVRKSWRSIFRRNHNKYIIHLPMVVLGLDDEIELWDDQFEIMDEFPKFVSPHDIADLVRLEDEFGNIFDNQHAYYVADGEKIYYENLYSKYMIDPFSGP